jgi:hypothetical protein
LPNFTMGAKAATSLQTKDRWAPAPPTGINMRTGLPSTRHWIRHWHVVGMFSCSPPIHWESNVLWVAIETAECPFWGIVIVGGSLNEIESSRHDCKPLRIIVDHQVNDIFIPRRHITAAAATNEWEATMGLFLSKPLTMGDR